MVNGLLLNIVMFSLGLAILLKAADYFTDSAANIARQFGISDLIIGMTLVAFATSLPELTVATTASLAGSPGIALGNVIGSNIANIGLILAIVLILRKIKIDKQSRHGGALMLIATIISVALISGGISRLDGALLFSMIAIFVLHTVAFSKPTGKAIAPKFDGSLVRLIILLIVSLGGVVIGGKFVVDAAVNLARMVGVSQIVIGVTIIAIGTSLPELTTALFAVKKGYSGIAVGNLVGSNLFNLTAILGISAIIAPIEITRRVAIIDIPFMLLFSVLLIALMHEKRAISKIYGAIFLAIYAVFIFLQLVKL